MTITPTATLDADIIKSFFNRWRNYGQIGVNHTEGDTDYFVVEWKF